MLLNSHKPVRRKHLTSVCQSSSFFSKPLELSFQVDKAFCSYKDKPYDCLKNM